MAMSSVSSEEFSFPSLISYDSSHHSVLDSPPLWKHSPENHHRSFKSSRLLIGNDQSQTKSFSYVETRSLCKTEEKMDMLWEDLNEEVTTRSQSLRIDPTGEKNTFVFSDDSSTVEVGCGMKLKPPKKKKKRKNPNVLMLMRVLKKILVLRSVSQRSPAKTHPRW
ncbi:hypothetical protein AALP_AA2G150400 [Arabis alpina]|uniref:Uncharacterized protein n=1 Tax=Arabis alpina TaxID=50452 RepID=A0A087HHK6_ARAAL|nr:hypothetical protein AALP_AA2G150400 [Arabis alpina]